MTHRNRRAWTVAMALGGGAIGALLGWGARVTLMPRAESDADGVSAHASPDPAASSSDDEAPRRSGAPPALAQRRDELRRRVAEEHAATDALLRELHGAPITWPREVADAHRPAEFERLLLQAIAECRLPLQLVTLDCEEPPCMAALRVMGDAGGRALVSKCGFFAQRYGAGSQQFRRVECGGRTEQATVVFAPIPDFHPGGLGKRLDYRRSQIVADWPCLRP